MSFEETILLSIRREYSGNEKYRLLLRHLDNVENELRAERKKNTELIKEREENLNLINARDEELILLQERINEYEGADDPKKYVLLKSHQKMMRRKEEYKKLFWELHTEHEKLKEKMK